MGVDAGVTIIFYNSDGEIIKKFSIDCYKFQANGKSFKIPSNAHSVKVYFSSEYDRYLDSEGDISSDFEIDDDCESN